MNKTILFVDDDEDDRGFVQEIILQERLSVNLIFAESGLKALDILSEGRDRNELPCLIVLDLNMPILDGKETFDRIRGELNISKVPIIIFTSSHNPHDKKLFNSQGIEFITKPSDMVYLREVVTHMVSVCGRS